MSAYSLSKASGVPYATISDLLRGKTTIENMSVKRALTIADCLGVTVYELLEMDKPKFAKFRYFRNNTLHELKRLGKEAFVRETIRTRAIDFYYKNDGKEYAFYLLALIDYLCNLSHLPIYQGRYNRYRSESLDKPFFVGGDLFQFATMEAAEEKLGMKVIPEFRRFNIIEVNVFNVA